MKKWFKNQESIADARSWEANREIEIENATSKSREMNLILIWSFAVFDISRIFNWSKNKNSARNFTNEDLYDKVEKEKSSSLKIKKNRHQIK